MDIATIFGILGGLGVISVAIGPARLGYFLDLTSFLIVLGGTFAAFTVNYPLRDLAGSIGIAIKTVFNNSPSTDQIIDQIIKFALIARKDGILALQSKIDEIQDPFFNKGLQLTIDGSNAQEVHSILSIELNKVKDRHKRGLEMMQTLGAFAPAFGMIGTLIGLVLMLQKLDDPSTIGPSMAIALLTTFYGALMANLIFLPLAGKLKKISFDELLALELIIEGMAAITEGMNPRMIEQKLNSFIPPSKRRSHFG
ncbi:MAG: motility protein A [Nitrospinota bacterium]